MGDGMYSDCVGKKCGWSVFGGVELEGRTADCSTGTGACRTAILLSAQSSDFHDESLINATKAIKEILAGIPDRQDRSLSFLHTNMGTLLAWVQHGSTVPKDAVTEDSDDAAVAEALGLILDSSYSMSN